MIGRASGGRSADLFGRSAAFPCQYAPSGGASLGVVPNVEAALRRHMAR